MVEEVSPEFCVRNLIWNESKLGLAEFNVHLEQNVGQERVLIQFKIERVGKLWFELHQQVFIFRKAQAVILEKFLVFCSLEVFPTAKHMLQLPRSGAGTSSTFADALSLCL